MLLLLLGCTPPETGAGGASFRLFAGDAGRLYELRVPSDGDTGDTGDTAGPPGMSRWLRVSEAAWTLTQGEDVDTAAPVATWVLTLEGGLRLDDTRLLPDTVVEGAAVDGGTVRAVGPWETVYGTFQEAAEVEVAEGPWAGTQVFAKGVGPVHLTIAGEPWETAWYE